MGTGATRENCLPVRCFPPSTRCALPSTSGRGLTKCPNSISITAGQSSLHQGAARVLGTSGVCMVSRAGRFKIITWLVSSLFTGDRCAVRSRPLSCL